jgi:uncharacterized protein YbaA (DUF1428 family)
MSPLKPQQSIAASRQSRLLWILRSSRSRHAARRCRPSDALWQSLARIAADMPFDGKRMISGGFTPIVDT